MTASPRSSCDSHLSADRPVVSIGDSDVSGANSVYVIAEAGVNHNGDATTAHGLIDAAREAGADAVKFQVFSADRLVSDTAPPCAYQTGGKGGSASQRDILRRLELEEAVFVELKAHADSVGIGFLATPFGLEELAFLVGLGVPAIKIASSDVVNVPLLQAAAGTGLPMIVSTGAADMSEIEDAVAIVGERVATHRLILLHCVSAYPTDPCDAGLACIGTLARRFCVPVGFSDHTREPDFSDLAVTAGACILEKHLTLDRAAMGPDHFFSLEPDMFARYVSGARRARAVLGDGRILVSPVEREVRELARGGIVAAVKIMAGEPIEAGHLRIQRPGSGIDSAKWNDVVGRTATTDIPAESRLSWSMLR